LIFEKVPLGALHVELVAPPPRLPERATVPPVQTVLGGPALAVALPTVTTIVETPAGQMPAGSFDVSVKVTVPLVMDGVYVDVNELAFEKVPPGALHVELVALPPLVPAKVIIPPAHTPWLGPAFTIAAVLIVTLVVAVIVQPKPSVTDRL